MTPLVRVMRLYKPGLHSSALSLVSDINTHDHSLSGHLLLPDNFGDIYIGENFRAYIAVVSGNSSIIREVNLHLLTSNLALDLQDTRNGITHKDETKSDSESLGYTDFIISHRLQEVGTHTLRVTVQYIINNEVKILRKFYRFNVLQPFTSLHQHTLSKKGVQLKCSCKNSTQNAIFIEQVSV